MPDTCDVLIVGATGMLGRPVARRLVRDGFTVRAMVRDPDRARAMLPGEVELVRGRLEDDGTVRSAARGAQAVYVNLSVPFRKSPPKWERERDGTAIVVRAARDMGVHRLLRISAMGVEETTNWWCAQHKAQADRTLMDSGLAWTVFRPTWFMESLATLWMGRFIMSINPGGVSLRWIAGDDYARQVSAALRSDAAIEKIYYPQGPELATIPRAVRRFSRVLPQRPRVLPIPLLTFSVMSLLSGQASYMRHLMRMTVDHFARLDQTAIATDLPTAAMTIEDYARSMLETGDRPSKT